jgi:hypothetical protein
VNIWKLGNFESYKQNFTKFGEHISEHNQKSEQYTKNECNVFCFVLNRDGKIFRNTTQIGSEKSIHTIDLKHTPRKASIRFLEKWKYGKICSAPGSDRPGLRKTDHTSQDGKRKPPVSTPSRKPS